MKKIKSIKNGLFGRNLSLAKMAFGAGKDFLSNRDSDLAQNILKTLENRSETLTHELGLMKGSVMKAGQALSTYLGEYLPDNIKKMLATLESQSYFLDWEGIKKEIPKEWFETLEFDTSPLAAASIGQVHLATNKKTKEVYAVKIQYPGVKKAINRDIMAIKLLISSLKVVPKSMDLSPVYEEIKEMLFQEMDYRQELTHIKEFTQLAKGRDKYKVLTPIEEFCSKNILTTNYEKAFQLRSEEVANLSQEERDELGRSFLELFYLELFEWRLVQTDGHFGNYLIEIDKETKKAKWVLLDFGATKKVEGEFLQNYQNSIRAVSTGDKDLFFASFKKMGHIKNFERFDQKLLWEYIELMGSPFQGQIYDWGKSDIPEKAMGYLARLLKIMPEGKAPKDTIFLDRKVASVFYVLKLLNCKFNAREVLARHLN